MNNLIFELKEIVSTARENNVTNAVIRIQVKEFLHYFVLDFIYNSQYKSLTFYGGSCLRIIYDLPRMSEDLDFEALENINLEKFAKDLEEYFNKQLSLKEKFVVKKEKRINRIFLIFPIMFELGLSPHKDETLRIKVEIRPISENYLKKLKPTATVKSKYAKSFIIKHYDLETLFASKLGAILDRPKKGYKVGRPIDKINFKGRDFFDLIWYMEKDIKPNEEMLGLNGIDKSIKEILEEIAIFIKSTSFNTGLKKDLEPLFSQMNYVENFANNYEIIFSQLKSKYLSKYRD